MDTFDVSFFFYTFVLRVNPAIIVLIVKGESSFNAAPYTSRSQPFVVEEWIIKKDTASNGATESILIYLLCMRMPP